ncbi:MAG TPA: hypothetical protein VJT75_07895, partial [Thermoleophilaceae bacterium]|nr:hypothetical protein [Thermoleophilaceae bacterium]
MANIRDLSFERVPKARVLPQAEVLKVARRNLRAELARLPEAQRALLEQDRRIGGQLPVLTGLVDSLPTGANIGEVVQLEGLYDERDASVFLIKGTFRGRRQTESVLAHELTHALDDQTSGQARIEVKLVSDASDAERAVREGSATLTQLLYERRYLGERKPIAAKLRTPSTVGASRLERIAGYELDFVYGKGALFLDALYRRGGATLVNRAVRNPPVTTVSILDPSRWPDDDDAVRPTSGGTPGPGWTRSYQGTFGAAGTEELLFLAAPRASVARLVREWAGGTVEIWQRPAAVRAKAVPTR